jgi:hypothetical protein
VGLVGPIDVVAATFRESGYSTPSTESTPSIKATHSALPQHQLRDLQGVEGSSLQELVATAPER